MTSRTSKQRQSRRERRKAKQSEWKREPKSNPKKVGHGPGSSGGLIVKTAVAKTEQPRKVKTVKKGRALNKAKPRGTYSKHITKAAVAELVDARD